MFYSITKLTSASITQPINESFAKKDNHYINLDEIGLLAAGMYYIHVQLPLNNTTIYCQSEILELNLKQILQHISNKAYLKHLAKQLKQPHIFSFGCLSEKTFEIVDFFQNRALKNPIFNPLLRKRRSF
jgi:hypothetical protein